MIQPDERDQNTPERRQRPIDEYITDLANLAKQYESDVADHLKIPREPPSGDAVSKLRARLLSSELTIADAAEKVVRIANVVVPRAGLRFSRAGLDAREKLTPVLGFVFVDPESKSISTILLKVPDGGPNLMDIAMGLHWEQLNEFSIGQAVMLHGKQRFFEIKNCEMSWFDQGHLKAATEEMQCNFDEDYTRLKSACTCGAYGAKRKSKPSDENASRARDIQRLQEFSKDRDRAFKVFLTAFLVVAVPAVVKIAEWLRLVPGG